MNTQARCQHFHSVVIANYQLHDELWCVAQVHVQRFAQRKPSSYASKRPWPDLDGVAAGSARTLESFKGIMRSLSSPVSTTKMYKDSVSIFHARLKVEILHEPTDRLSSLCSMSQSCPQWCGPSTEATVVLGASAGRSSIRCVQLPMP